MAMARDSPTRSRRSAASRMEVSTSGARSESAQVRTRPAASELVIGEQGAAADGDDGDAVAAGGGQHADWGLASQALRVQRPLAGDHQVGAGDGVVEAGQLQHRLDARPQFRPQQRHRAEAGTTRCASPRHVPQVLPSGRRDQVGPVAERCVEECHLVRGRTLLRPVDRRRARRSGQRVVDVGGHHHGHPRQPPAHLREVQRDCPRERRSARRDRRTRGVQHPRPQGHREAGAAVGRAAATHTQHHLGAAGVHGGRDQLAGAERACRRRREPVHQPLEPRSVGELDDRRPSPPGVRRSHRLPGRPGDRGGHRRRSRPQRLLPGCRHRRRPPGPPRRTRTAGTRWMPRESAAATSAAGSEPLNLSLATTMRTAAGIRRRARSSPAPPARRPSSAAAAGCPAP